MLYVDWKYHICKALLNLFDIAAFWFILADPFAEHANDSSHHQTRTEMVIAAGLGWAFSDLFANNVVGIARQFMQYSFSLDFIYAGVSSNLDITLVICTALMIAKLMRSARTAKK